MLEKYHKLQPKNETSDELKVALQTIWEEMPREHVNKVVAIFTKCLTAYVAVAANGGHSKHLHSAFCSNSVHLQVCILISPPTNWLFSETSTDYQ